MKNTIKFSENGKTFTFMFANGSESVEIESKEEGFKAITSLANEKKISAEEFAEMRDQILHAENLAWSSNDDENFSLKITLGRIKIPKVIFEGLVFDVFEQFVDFINVHNFEGVSTFAVCECGTHGKIYAFLDAETVYVGRDVESKNQAMESLNQIIEGKNFPDEVIEKLKKEIAESTLPENVDTEMTETNS